MNLVAWGGVVIAQVLESKLAGETEASEKVQRHWRTLFRGPVARAQ